MRVVALSLSVALALALACASPGSEPDADGGPDRFAGYGEPLEAPPEQWTWVPFEDSACGNGEPTGISINLSPGASEVLLYLEGGGLCFDDYTCNQQQTATFVKTGYNRVDAEDFVVTYGGRGIFDRGSADNPFRGHHFVYVPYCTGDLHAGSREDAPYGVTHAGYKNLGAFLHRVVPTFPEVEQVVLAGTSAGGFGALFNYDRVRRSFLDVPVQLLMDSAPPFTTDLIPLSFQTQQRLAWDVTPAIPEGCETCGDLFGTFQFIVQRWPDVRVGLVSSLEDSTLRFLIGLGLGGTGSISAAQYRAALVTLLEQGFVDRPGSEMFLVPGHDHVFVYRTPLSSVVVDGVPMSSFLSGLVHGTGFTTVLPP